MNDFRILLPNEVFSSKSRLRSLFSVMIIIAKCHREISGANDAITAAHVIILFTLIGIATIHIILIASLAARYA